MSNFIKLFFACCVVWSLRSTPSTWCVAAEHVHCARPRFPHDLTVFEQMQPSPKDGFHIQGRYTISELEALNDRGHQYHHYHNVTWINTNEESFMRFSIQSLSEGNLTLSIKINHMEHQADVSDFESSQGSEKSFTAYIPHRANLHLSILYEPALASSVQCPEVLIEVAIRPKFSYICDLQPSSVPSFPIPIEHIDTGMLENQKHIFSYESQDGLWFSSDDANKIKYIKRPERNEKVVISSIPIQFTHLMHRSNLWKFRVEIRYDFLSGGSISAILKEHGEQSAGGRCPTGGCALEGVRALKNTYILQGEVAGPRSMSLEILVHPTALNKTCALYWVSISIFPLNGEETLFSCEADVLPQTLNSPGLYDSRTGTLNFNRYILLSLFDDGQKTEIQPSVDSFLRLYLGPHDVYDVDVYLFKNQTQEAFSFSKSGPEGIVYHLQAHETYQLSFVTNRFFRLKYIFEHDFVDHCDTISLRLFVQPVAAQRSSMVCESSVLPDPEYIANLVHRLDAFPNSFSGNYRFLDTDSKMKQKEIMAFDFEVPENVYIQLWTAATFPTGGIPMKLIANNSTDTVLYSQLDLDKHYIHTNLSKGTSYRLSLLSGYVQAQDVLYSTYQDSIDPCTVFSFHLYVDLVPPRCPLEVYSLNELYTMRITNATTHFSEVIELKARNSLSIVSKTEVNFLHVEVSRAPFLLDMLLLKENPHSNSSNGEPAQTVEAMAISHSSSELVLFYALDANQSYELVFNGPQTPIAECLSFQLEFSISTGPPNKIEWSQGCTPQIPPASLLEISALPYTHDNTYRWCDTSKAEQVELPFSIAPEWGEVHMKIVVEYDFSLTNIFMKLCQKDEIASQTIRKAPECMWHNDSQIMNRKSILAASLPSGSYILILQKYAQTQQQDSTRIFATDFRLRVHLATTTQLEQRSDTNDPVLCAPWLQYLPKSLNSVGYFEPENKYMHLHIFQDVLVAKFHSIDLMELVITEPSIWRLNLPLSSDSKSQTSALAILSRADGDKKGRSIMTHVGNAVTEYLEPGLYTVLINYWDSFFSNNFLSRQHTCHFLPLEMSIVPVRHIEKDSYAFRPCEEAPVFPSQLQSSKSVLRYHDLGNVENYGTHKLHLTLDASSYVAIDVYYDFEIRHFNSELRGEIKNDEVVENMPPQYPIPSYGMQSYNLILHPGDYEFIIGDGEWKELPDQLKEVLKCQHWMLDVHFTPFESLATGTADNGMALQNPLCLVLLREIPNDVRSIQHEETGELELLGSDFALPVHEVGERKVVDMAFDIRVPSLVSLRTFTAVERDIDLLMESCQNEILDSCHGTHMHYESLTAIVSPTSTPCTSSRSATHFVRLYFYHNLYVNQIVQADNSTLQCEQYEELNSLSLMLYISPLDTVRRYFETCINEEKNQLPLLTNVEGPHKSRGTMHKSMIVPTPDESLNSHESNFHTIHLSLKPGTIYQILLDMEYKMNLYQIHAILIIRNDVDKTEKVIAEGLPQLNGDSSNQNTGKTTLEAFGVDPGEYDLIFLETPLMKLDHFLSHWCVSFDMYLSVERDHKPNAQYSPSLLNMDPAVLGMKDVHPHRGFTVLIELSEPAYPRSDLKKFVSIPANASWKRPPQYTVDLQGTTTVRIHFFRLQYGTLYEFALNPDNLEGNSTKESFTYSLNFPMGPYRFETLPCSCESGYCENFSPCTCQLPSEQCNTCKPGWNIKKLKGISRCMPDRFRWKNDDQNTTDRTSGDQVFAPIVPVAGSHEPAQCPCEHGRCVGETCVCLPNYDGPMCNHLIEYAPDPVQRKREDAGNVCDCVHGKCIGESCICYRQYSGARCEIFDGDAIDAVTTATAFNSTHVSKKPRAKKQQDDENSYQDPRTDGGPCTDVRDCLHGACILNRCVCDSGYWGRQCSDSLFHEHTKLTPLSAAVSYVVAWLVLILLIFFTQWNFAQVRFSSHRFQYLSDLPEEGTAIEMQD